MNRGLIQKFLPLALLAMFPCRGSGATELPEATLGRVVDSDTAFAVDLYHREATQPGNLFFSPYSISTALAMTEAGARGDTEKEMARVLHFDLPSAELHPAMAVLAQRLETIAKGGTVHVSVANSLWCQRDHAFTDAFLALNRDCYHAATRALDFADEPAARGEINAWVAQKTENKIQNLLPPGQLSVRTRLVLCNAIYFKGKWSAPFDPRATRPAPFFVGNGRQVDASMMSRQCSVRSQSLSDVQLVELPYQGNELSLVILLPKTVDGLAALERRVDATTLRDWLKQLAQSRMEQARIVLPKFKQTCRLDLAGDLAAMGMPLAFGPTADFSGVDGTRLLYLSAVVHQAFVDVSEEGTEAAAATAVGMVPASVMMLPPEIRMDHPFLFLIRENKTGNLLFFGRLVDPSK